MDKSEYEYLQIMVFSLFFHIKIYPLIFIFLIIALFR